MIEEMYSNIVVWMNSNGYEEKTDSIISQIRELHGLIEIYKAEFDASRTITMAAIWVLEQNGILRDDIRKILPSSSEIFDDSEIYKKEYDYLLKIINLKEEIINLERTYSSGNRGRKNK